MEYDKLSAVLEAGLSLDEIERMQRAGATQDEIIFAAYARLERGESLSDAADEPQADVPWSDPVPFDSYTLPSFPTEALPDPVEAFIEALTESTQTPLEMSALLSLGVMATALQRRYSVQITPDWMEPLNLFTLVVAPPAERKSAVLSAVTRPLRDFERDRREIDAPLIAQNRTERKLLEGMKTSAETAAVRGKADERGKKRQEALDLAAELAEFRDFHELRLLADDATPERLADLMEQQGGAITLCSSEGGVFDAMRGRYERGLKLDVYLKGHAGDPLTVDRMGRASNRIENPRLSTLLAVQPDVLSGIMDNSSFRGRGLCGRFLYAICRGNIGHRKVNPESVPAGVREAYYVFIRRLLEAEDEGVITLSGEADRLRCEFQETVEKRLGYEWETIRDWAGKLVGAVCRIAAILHCGVVSKPAREPVSSETFEAAISIGEFLGLHAQAAFGLMGASKTEEDAKYIARRIIGQCEISRSDLTKLCQGHFKRAREMEEALTALEERGYIRVTETSIGYQGRSRRSYLINPALQEARQ